MKSVQAENDKRAFRFSSFRVNVFKCSSLFFDFTVEWGILHEGKPNLETNSSKNTIQPFYKLKGYYVRKWRRLAEKFVTKMFCWYSLYPSAVQILTVIECRTMLFENPCLKYTWRSNKIQYRICIRT